MHGILWTTDKAPHLFSVPNLYNTPPIPTNVFMSVASHFRRTVYQISSWETLEQSLTICHDECCLTHSFQMFIQSSAISILHNVRSCKSVVKYRPNTSMIWRGKCSNRDVATKTRTVKFNTCEKRQQSLIFLSGTQNYKTGISTIVTRFI
jgi:hypothetical protein